jgi:hypothetical protein
VKASVVPLPTLGGICISTTWTEIGKGAWLRHSPEPMRRANLYHAMDLPYSRVSVIHEPTAFTRAGPVSWSPGGEAFVRVHSRGLGERWWSRGR